MKYLKVLFYKKDHFNGPPKDKTRMNGDHGQISTHPTYSFLLYKSLKINLRKAKFPIANIKRKNDEFHMIVQLYSCQSTDSGVGRCGA